MSRGRSALLAGAAALAALLAATALTRVDASAPPAPAGPRRPTGKVLADADAAAGSASAIRRRPAAAPPRDAASARPPAGPTPGVRLTGAVLDADGSALATAWVALWSGTEEPAAASPVAAAETTPAGRFELPAVPPGRYRLQVLCPDRPTLEHDELQLSADEPTPDLTLHLPRGAIATGHVLPWPHPRRVAVELEHDSGVRRRATVASDGSYRLERLTPGRYRARVACLDPSMRTYVAAELQREQPVELVLDDGAVRHLDLVDPAMSLCRLRGHVRDHSEPGSLEVLLQRLDPPLPPPLANVFRAAPDQGGAFTIDGLPPGRWRLELAAAGAVRHRATLQLQPHDDRLLWFELGN